MQYTEQDLANLINSVEQEFSVALAKAEGSTAQPAPLAKAEDDKPSEDKKTSEDKPDSEPKAKENEGESKEAPKAKDGEGESKENAAPAEEAAPAAPQEGAQPPAAPAAEAQASGYDAEDIAHMDQMYMSMSKAELIAHHDSCVRALDAIGAEHTHAAAPAAPAEAQAPAAQAAPNAEIDKCGDMSMSKSEKEQTPAAPVVADVTKTENDLLKSENESLKKNLDGIQEFLTQLVKKVPQGKAITSYEQVQKSESTQVEGGEVQLTKSEISAILTKRAAEPTLAKSDREAINAFYLNGANINTISHLLK